MNVEYRLTNNDFQKELRETFVCLKLIDISKLYKTESNIIKAKQENNELISIFVKSIETTRKNHYSAFSIQYLNF